MRLTRVLVIGGSGFIGSAIVARLVERGVRVVVPTRRYAHARDLLPLPTVDVVEADVHDRGTLAQLVRRSDAVVNLVGLLHSRRGDPYGPAFARAHVDLPRAIVAAMTAHGVTRLVHMSALGAAQDAPSMYLRSKADGEAAARSEPGIAWTIFRPSVVFGEHDRSVNLFARLARISPVLPIGCASSRLQPVWVGDVAQAFVNALPHDTTFGKTYVLAGPRVYTLRELVQAASVAAGHPRRVIGLPMPLARLQATVFEHLPGKLLSRDNLDSLRTDSVAPSGWTWAPELGVEHPTALEPAAAQWMHARDPRRGFDAYRAQARR